ncbi:MAG: glycosyltransferase family 4 protein [Oligoflexia bacterium]|nr:glycosyltransferase family 4 protein [Oligoflexia bacterium]
MSRPIRIGFNGRTFSDDRVRGFTRHTLELLGALEALPARKELHLFSDRRIAAAHLSALSRFRQHRSRVKPHLAWEQAALPVELAMSRIEVFHSTTNIGVPYFPLSAVKRVVTVHDLITLNELSRELPRDLRALRARASHELSWKATLSADAIVTVSRYSARQIETRFPRIRKKIHVIPNGVDPRFSAGPAELPVLDRYGLREQGHLLYVGGFEERKNVALLVRAYLEAFGGRAGTPGLVLVGDFTEAPRKLLQAAKGPEIRWLGYVPDSELISLYRSARCVVVPSRDEGFGFQLLEAMACGAPVLSSNATSLPEVGGDAVEYFYPSDLDALKSLLLRTESDEPWLQALRKKGLARAQEFSWKDVARRTFELYQELQREAAK